MVLDFLDPDSFDPDNVAERAKPVVATVASLGVPFLTDLSPTTFDIERPEIVNYGLLTISSGHFIFTFSSPL